MTTRNIGDKAQYTTIDGKQRVAVIQRWVETTIIAHDAETGKEVVFDESDMKQWIPRDTNGPSTKARPADVERYQRACHAMQSGVKYTMENIPDDKSTSPKMLRTGVNAAMVEHSALAHLLMLKGVITEADYYAAMADGMEEEVRRYEATLSEHFNKKVTLG